MKVSDIQKYELDIDLKENIIVYVECKQLDSLNLIFNVYDDGAVADLTNYKARLKAYKSDTIPLIQNTNVDITNNVTKIIADEQLTTTSGITKIELQFINKVTGEKKTSFDIHLKVIASTLEVNRSISKATCTLLEELEEALDKVEDLNANTIEAIKVNNELKNTTIPTAKSSNTSLSTSITDGRKLKNDLDTSSNNATTIKNDLDSSRERAALVNEKLESNINKADPLNTNLNDNIGKAENIRDEIKTEASKAESLIAEVRPISDMIKTITNHINDTEIHFKKGEKALLNTQIEQIFNLLNILLNENVVYLVDDDGNHFVDDDGNEFVM
nr:MAG TPA: BppU domain protein [Caudoviricetes sp.]